MSVGMYLLPVSLLIYEVYRMDVISSESRALGTLMLLVIAGASMPLMIEARMEHMSGLFKAGIMLGSGLPSCPSRSPLHHHEREALDTDVLNRGADQVMLGGLLISGNA